MSLMGKHIFFLILAGFLILVSHPALTCEEILASEEDFTARIEDFRKELRGINDTYQAEYPNRAISMLRGIEHQVLPIVNEGPRSHAIYFASGADIFRLVYDFPLVKHYHLVDLMTGWGRSPREVIVEILHRLKYFSDRLELLEKGFVPHLPSSILNHRTSSETMNSFLQSGVGGHNFNFSLKPIILKVEWQSPSLGKIVKIFYIHLLNIMMPDHITALVNTIPSSHALVGMLWTGLGGIFPRNVLDFLLMRAKPQSPFIYEKLVPSGTPSRDIEDAFRDVLGEGLDFQIIVPTSSQSHFFHNDPLHQNRVEAIVIMR